jgi:ornithine cyclodeaminase
MRAVRPVRRVRVWSRQPANREAFVKWTRERLGVPVEAAGTAREAVLGADLVCTVTSARDPVLLGEWLAPGAHVNAVGASLPEARELDTAAVARARLFVDRRESAQHEAGEYLIPLREGAIGADHIAGELGDLVTGAVAGRRRGDEITLFKSLGLAIEDVAAAHFVHAAAEQEGVGLVVELGGVRDER